MSNRIAALPSLAITLALLAGCGESPSSARLATNPVVVPVSGAAPVTAAPAAAKPATREVVLGPAASAPAAGSPTEREADAVERSIDADAEEPTLTAMALAGVPVEEEVADPATPVEVAAYSAASRTDAAGVGIASTYYSDPVYLTPRAFPIILPGSPSELPAFTPRQVDMSKMPTDAVNELGRLKRLREAKKTWLSWLFGFTFPAISTQDARNRLAEGTTVWLGPDGSKWHMDKTFKQVNDIAVLDAMLPELQADALDAETAAVRYANIVDRQNLLPAFNRTYDITKLVLLDLIVSDYTYGGQPVRRGMVAAAAFWEQAAVKKSVATWWEDHPDATAAEIRQAVNRVLGQKFQAVALQAEWYAERPGSYSDTQLIPGLRDPRPITELDRMAHDADVAYNKSVLRSLGQAMPSVLSSAVYP